MCFLILMGKTHILTMLYCSHLTIFSIDNQYEKGANKNAMEWSTTAYFPIFKRIAPIFKVGAIRLSAIRIIYFLTIRKKTTTSLCVKSVFSITS